MSNDHPIPPSVTRVHRHGAVVDGSTGRRVGQPSGNRQAEPQRRDAAPTAAPAAAPITVTIHAGWTSMLRSATTDAERDGVLAQLVTEAIRAATPAIEASLWQRAEAPLLSMLNERCQAAYKRGRAAGLRAGSVELRPSAELLEALRQPAPVVNVAPAAVAVTNEVVVPARKVIAKTLPNGSVEMSPVDE